jgi:phosphoserine phosphatase
MNKTEKKYAFFDLDYTIIPHDTILLLGNFIIRREPYRLFYLIFLIPVLLPTAVGFISSKTFKRIFLSVLAGYSQEKTRHIFEEFVDKCVLPELYPLVLDEIKKNKEEGFQLILNSASISAYTDIIAQRLGFDISIGTTLVIEKTMPLIPRITGLNNKRAAKILHMMDHLPEDFRKAWSSYTEEMAAAKKPYPKFIIPGSRAYTDSPADLPMLDMAEYGFLVNPSASFEHIGLERKYTIFKPKKPFRNIIHKYWLIALQLIGLYKFERNPLHPK